MTFRDTFNILREVASAPDMRGRVTPALLKVTAHVIQAESSGRTYESASTSSARGLGQMLDGEWAANQRRAPLAFTRNGVFDPVQNSRMTLNAMITYNDDARRFLHAHGVNRDPLPEEIYIEHFAGQGGGHLIMNAILSGRGGASAADILGPRATAANSWLRNYTAEGLMGQMRRKMNEPIGIPESEFTLLPIQVPSYEQYRANMRAADTLSRHTGGGDGVIDVDTASILSSPPPASPRPRGRTQRSPSGQ